MLLEHIYKKVTVKLLIKAFYHVVAKILGCDFCDFWWFLMLAGDCWKRVSGGTQRLCCTAVVCPLPPLSGASNYQIHFALFRRTEKHAKE